MLWSICGGILFGAYGLFIFLRPDLLWRLTEQWKSYRADEPSELYVKTVRIGGAGFVILGIAMIVLPFILE